MTRPLVFGLALLFGATSAFADASEDCDKKSGVIAIQGCSELIRLNPANASGYLKRGKAYYENGNYDQAIADYTKAIEINPNDADYYKIRGDAYGGKKEDLGRALSDYTKAIELAPQRSGLFVRRGVVYAAKKDYGRAIADFTKGIELEPRDDEAYLRRALVYGENEDYDRAIFDCGRALQFDSTFGDAISCRAYAFEKKGDKQRAIADYQRLLALAPDDEIKDALRRLGARPSPSERCDGVEVEVRNERRCVKPGTGKTDWFKDCSTCPEMVVVPAGRFTMGSPKDEPGRFEEEDRISVAIAKPFAVGRFAVTRGEFATFVTAAGYKNDGGCTVLTGSKWEHQTDSSWRSVGFPQTDRHPVVCVSWNDAKAYVAWLTSATGTTYRLLSETEREFVARASTTTPFWWGATISTSQANYNGNYWYSNDADGSKGEWRKATVAVDIFAANPWGLYNLHGNVWEWTEDCWNKYNNGNPSDGSARTSGECSSRVLRGGSWVHSPRDLRSARRAGGGPDDHRHSTFGFRVARML